MADRLIAAALRTAPAWIDVDDAGLARLEAAGIGEPVVVLLSGALVHDGSHIAVRAHQVIDIRRVGALPIAISLDDIDEGDPVR